MATLTEVLTSDSKKSAVVDDCCSLIESEVGDKGGISGLAIKAGYGAVKGIKPGFIKNVVTDLLPDFANALDPLYQEATSAGKSVSEHFNANASRAADLLLSITDAKAERSKSGVVKGTYGKLRSTAKKNVESAIARLGKVVEKHVG